MEAASLETQPSQEVEEDFKVESPVTKGENEEDVKGNQPMQDIDEAPKMESLQLCLQEKERSKKRKIKENNPIPQRDMRRIQTRVKRTRQKAHLLCNRKLTKRKRRNRSNFVLVRVRVRESR